jgi:hypothetical protein
LLCLPAGGIVPRRCVPCSASPPSVVQLPARKRLNSQNLNSNIVVIFFSFVFCFHLLDQEDLRMRTQDGFEI